MRISTDGEIIPGHVQQVDVSTSLHDSALTHQWHQLIISTANSLSIDTTDKHIVCPKLLIAHPGDGQQAVHWDDHRHIQSQQKLTCLLYCTHTYSTAMPRFPMQVLFR